MTEEIKLSKYSMTQSEFRIISENNINYIIKEIVPTTLRADEIEWLHQTTLNYIEKLNNAEIPLPRIKDNYLEGKKIFFTCEHKGNNLVQHIKENNDELFGENMFPLVKEMLKVIKKAQKANLAIDPHLKNFVICPKGKISYVDFCPPYGTEYNKKVINSVHNDYQELVKKNLEFFNAEALGYHFAGDLLKENKNYEAAMPELYKTLCEEEIIDDSISYEEFLSRAKEIKEVELERARKGIFLI